MKRLVIVILAAIFLWPPSVSAHDVPDNVNVVAFLKPESGHMLILVRMPANALVDFLFPTLPDGNWLDLKQVDGLPTDGAKVWIADLLSIYENGRALPAPTLLAARISRADDASFSSFQSALGHIKGDPLSTATLVTQDTATVDALLETPIHSVDSNFSFQPRFERVGVRVITTLSFLPANGGVRSFQYEGDPEIFELNPGTSYAIVRFIKAGFTHYFNQTDYLLFALCVALAFRRFNTMLPFSMTFVGAQTCALLGSMIVMPVGQWTPVFCGLLIAAATVYVGIEAIVTEEAGKTSGLAIGTGLIFGWGFWFGLQPTMQFGGVHHLASALAFNTGITFAEIGALMLLVVVNQLVRQYSKAARTVVIIAAAIAIHVAWHRMLDRAQTFRLVFFSVPATNQNTFLFGGTIAITAVTVVVYYWRRKNYFGVARSRA